MSALLVGQPVLSVTFSLSSVRRKWAKILSAPSAFPYKTEKRVSRNSVPLVFLAPCLPYTRRARQFFSCRQLHLQNVEWLASENVKVGQDSPNNVSDQKAYFWLSTSSRQRPSFHLCFYNAWSNGLRSSLETVPAVILSVFINSNHHKGRKLMETKDGELQLIYVLFPALSHTCYVTLKKLFNLFLF